jgi:hypothetical protein
VIRLYFCSLLQGPIDNLIDHVADPTHVNFISNVSAECAGIVRMFPQQCSEL